MALGYFVLVLIILLIIFIYLYSRLRRKVFELKEGHERLKFDYKSMNVKHGKHFESFVPFMEDYPGEKENTVFLGNPIDFISFDDDSVKFIEVKTGKSGLNEKQKQVKRLIESGKVEWFELRFEK
ncbi:MAG: Holliday junction resolvase-like protein [Candidatus Woesearchaeota archaeon]